MSIHQPPARIEAAALPPEIAFLFEQGVSRETLVRAVILARACGGDAATTLLHYGLISEETFYRALARRLGTRFLDGAIALSDHSRYPRVAKVDAAPLAEGQRQAVVAAPRGRTVARLIAAVERGLPPPAIATPTRLREAVFAHHARGIVSMASDDLMRLRPEWSCRPGAQAADLTLAGLVLALGIVVTNLPNGFGHAVLALTQMAVLGMLAIRLAATFVETATDPEPSLPLLPDDRLPTYTIMVALHREARVVQRLIYTLSKLDYPPAKLQVMFVLEADDTETLAAFRAAPMPARFEVVVVPDGLPRTKPRGLNAALPLARGDLLVVYDADDVVDPMQLRVAASLFARAGRRTACLQGRLVLDNTADSWLTRLFALEYSALFDVIGPALARWRMPIPLGGTTTHFRTTSLRDILLGWDAWNVTEDADLGMRIASMGYEVGDLPSSTFEEAPEGPRAWLRQRTRWMKGFIQTSFTYGRHPLALWRRLGTVRMLVAVTLLPGTVLSALVYPVLTLLTGYRLLLGESEPDPGWLSYATSAGSVLVFVTGLAAMLLPAALGCRRRRWPDLMKFVPLLPLYFLLVSAAAWLAVIELARHPHRWNKTEHGLSRTSRSGALHLRRKRQPLTASSSARPPLPAAAARG